MLSHSMIREEAERRRRIYATTQWKVGVRVVDADADERDERLEEEEEDIHSSYWRVMMIGRRTIGDRKMVEEEG